MVRFFHVIARCCLTCARKLEVKYMHIPSERIYSQMRAEVASIWYVPANDGEEVSLLIKAPTPTLKALIMGCPIHLLFGKKDTYLWSLSGN